MADMKMRPILLSSAAICSTENMKRPENISSLFHRMPDLYIHDVCVVIMGHEKRIASVTDVLVKAKRKIAGSGKEDHHHTIPIKSEGRKKERKKMWHMSSGGGGSKISQ